MLFSLFAALSLALSFGARISLARFLCGAWGILGGMISLALGFLAWVLLPAVSGLLGTGRTEPG